jgi:hypothetical protein
MVAKVGPQIVPKWLFQKLLQTSRAQASQPGQFHKPRTAPQEHLGKQSQAKPASPRGNHFPFFLKKGSGNRKWFSRRRAEGARGKSGSEVWFPPGGLVASGLTHWRSGYKPSGVCHIGLPRGSAVDLLRSRSPIYENSIVRRIFAPYPKLDHGLAKHT